MCLVKQSVVKQVIDWLLHSLQPPISFKQVYIRSHGQPECFLAIYKYLSKWRLLRRKFNKLHCMQAFHTNVSQKLLVFFFAKPRWKSFCSAVEVLKDTVTWPLQNTTSIPDHNSTMLHASLNIWTPFFVH